MVSRRRDADTGPASQDSRLRAFTSDWSGLPLVMCVFEKEFKMLVLSRKLSEQILIGSEIAITIIEIRKGVVRIGIQAPKTMNVVRAELLETINIVRPQLLAKDAASC